MLKSKFVGVIGSLSFVAFALTSPAQNVPAPEATVESAEQASEIDKTSPETIPTVLRRVQTEGAQDQVFYAPAGVERMRIDSDTGHISVGTTGTVPPSRLFVAENADVASVVQIDNQNLGASASAMFRSNSDLATVNMIAHGSGRTSTGRFGAVLSGWSELLQTRGLGLIVGTYGSAPVTLGTNSTSRIHITADGKIGIGTNTPTALLHLYGAPTTDTFMGFGTHTTDGPAFTAGHGGLSFGRSAGFINVRPDTQAVAPNPSLRFLTANVQRMIITNLGRVGIGTLAPTESLDVAGSIHATGDIRADGVIHAKYQDFAEWVPATANLDSGTVVVLSRAKMNEVTPSAGAYDTKVAGVVSGQPGIILGEGGDGKEMVATTGRVRVKVDATQAPIEIGDLLVTSELAGHAMKSVTVEVAGLAFHRPGTIIGKALEPLPSGTGEILVLLSLQ